MEENTLYLARVQVVEVMEQGLPWHEAANRAELQISQSTAYRLRQRMRQGGKTWQRLQPFFRLPGRVQWGREVIQVEVRPFNNRQLTRDLLAVCQRVNELQPKLPDGRLLILHASSSPFG